MIEVESKADVLVVGAGIIGIACAHYLVRAGYKVTVIDQSTIGSGCSASNCGHISPSHVLPLAEPGAISLGLKSLFDRDAAFRVKPQLSLSLLRWMVEFARRCNQKSMLLAASQLKPLLDSSMSEFHDLVSDLECDWQDSGLLYVLETEKGLKEFRKTNNMINDQFGFSANPITSQELPDFDPAFKQGLAGAFHYSGDAHLRPDLLAHSWSELLKKEGVRFIEQCTLKTLSVSNKQIDHLHTSNGVMKAEHYVIAAGAWSSTLANQLGCSVPVQPGKGYSVTMSRPTICPSHSALFPEHRIGVTPFRDSYRLGSMMEFVGFDDTIPDRRINQLIEWAKPYLKEPSTNTILEKWQGWRPMTWDSLPILGRAPNLANTFMATGHNMLGVTMATGSGKLISELVQGHTTHIDSLPFSPSRF